METAIRQVIWRSSEIYFTNMKLKYERTRTLENTQCRTLGNNQIEEQMFKITYIIALSSEIYYKMIS
jgi:hypothetical protein